MTMNIQEAAIRLHPQDPLAVARRDLPAGMLLEGDAGTITLRQAIPSGHKLALERIEAGELVLKYGQVIGVAKQSIEPGEHVHTHNLGLGEGGKRRKVDARKGTSHQEQKQREFLGYLRKDGRTGTRNYVAVLATVNCSAHTAQQIARYFTPERLKDYPNVDGVIALVHPYGCGVDQDGENYVLLQRTLAGMARHPNVGASLLVGLGCEGNQARDLLRHYALESSVFVIQELGGIRKTVAAGIEQIQRLLPQVNAVRRQPRPLSELVVALQCGGSDGWSGVTANPLVGLAADEVVRAGGAVLLAETPEIYGAEHLLTSRAADAALAEKLMAQVRWWEEHTQRLGTGLDTNRSPGNAAGGLTTIYEKALGAVAKAGSTPLTGVYAYAETVNQRGLGFMNSPGNDAIAVTGQVAGGCNLVLFTTGRGSAFGFKPAPSIKISTNSPLFERMEEDMDLDAGRVLAGERMEEVAGELVDLMVEVASGKPSKSEAQGVGEAEFSPWFLGGVL